MFRMNRFIPLAAGLVLAGAAGAQSAGEMTADEITEAFNKQKTRGLVLVPTNPQAEAPAQTETATTVAPVETEVAYSEVDRADQVNVQISFDFDSAAIKPSFYGILTNVSNVMINYAETVVQIAGHTDSVGSEAYNQGLSVERAGAVRNFLVGQGVSPARMAAIGFGENYPIASNDTEYGRAQNRRVEIVLTPQSGG